MLRLLKTLYLIARVSPPYEQELDEAQSIYILGDSTGYGTGASKKEESIAGLIGTNFPSYTIRNNSKNGRTIGDLKKMISRIEGQYKLILLQIGGNDILQSRDVLIVEKELREIIKKLSLHTKNILMISSGNIGAAIAFEGSDSIKYESLTRKFRKMFMIVSLDTPIVYIDLFLEPENDPFVTEPSKYFSWDGLHPNSNGYAFWYESLKASLKDIL